MPPGDYWVTADTLELRASYVVKVWLPIPADHPLRRGRVNADIIAAE